MGFFSRSNDDEYESVSEDEEEYEDEEEEEEYEEDEEIEEEDEEEDSVKPEDVPALLRLAAEHDRVDILQDLLGRDPDADHLNTSHHRSSGGGGGEDRSFVPPLHAAVSSGSVHAATCLLRLGADPSIRPRIDDSHSDDRSFDGASAYELLRRRNLSAGKRRGIAHAFFAEALRAVGADDAARLECLLRSGMTAGGDDDDTTNGEKSLLEWARDLTENREPGGCYHLLESWGKEAENVDEPEQDEEPRQRRIAKSETRTESASSSPANDAPADERGRDDDYDDEQQDVQLLRLRIEEVQALEDSLIPILEDLTEETSVCRDLLGSGSSSLINHVRRLKAVKAQRESEAKQYDQLIREADAELDRLTYACFHQRRITQDDDKEELEEKQTNGGASHNDDAAQDTSEAELRATLAARLEEKERKVDDLRSSLRRAAEENASVVAEVDEQGLSGALRIARTLREEVSDLSRKVDRAREEEQARRVRARDLQREIEEYEQRRQAREEKESPPPLRPQSRAQDKEDNDGDEAVVERNERTNEEEDNVDNAEYESDSEYATDDDDEYTDEEDEDLEELAPSAAIATGRSRALVARSSTSSSFPLDLWDLLCRIVGLGHTAARRTGTEATAQLGRHTSGIMIV